MSLPYTKMKHLCQMTYSKLSAWESLSRRMSDGKYTDPQKVELNRLIERGLWVTTARATTDKEWETLLERIPDRQVRCKVGSLLWWDYNPKSRYLFKLVKAFDRTSEPEESIVSRALVSIGVPQSLASERSTHPAKNY